MTAAPELRAADALMSSAGKTFHQASRLLPKAVREDVVNLYAFCRTVDDLADDSSLPLSFRRRSLESLATELEKGREFELRAAGWPFAAEGVLAQTAGMLVRAALGDLDQRQPKTEADVLDYAFGVAGTVGIMMANVLRADIEGYGAAVALGMAMQLSNICRDVAEDMHAGRVYLPSEWVEAESIARAINIGEVADARLLSNATKRLLATADSLYEVACDGIWSLPWRMRWSILAASMCYREIGIEVGRDVQRSWRRRIVISTTRKLWLIARAGLRLLLPRFWRPARVPWPPELGVAAFNKGLYLGVTA